MGTTHRLTLAEELLLVAIEDGSGTLLPTTPFALDLVMAAAVVAALTTGGRSGGQVPLHAPSAR